jgi:hypothetical protein
MCLTCPRLVHYLFAIIDLSWRAEAINQSGNGQNPGGVRDALRPRASFRIGQTSNPGGIIAQRSDGNSPSCSLIMTSK